MFIQPPLQKKLTTKQTCDVKQNHDFLRSIFVNVLIIKMLR